MLQIHVMGVTGDLKIFKVQTIMGYYEWDIMGIVNPIMAYYGNLNGQ